MKTIKMADRDRLELHNLMLQIAVEEEKIRRYELLLSGSNKKINELRDLIKVWTDNYGIKLKDEEDIDIKRIIIDPEKGTVVRMEEGNEDDINSGRGESGLRSCPD